MLLELKKAASLKAASFQNDSAKKDVNSAGA